MGEPTRTEPDELRVADVAHEDYRTACVSCGRSLMVFFNAGELDSRYCCGFAYQFEHVRVDFVITPRPPAPADRATLSR